MATMQSIILKVNKLCDTKSTVVKIFYHLFQASNETWHQHSNSLMSQTYFWYERWAVYSSFSIFLTETTITDVTRICVQRHHKPLNHFLKWISSLSVVFLKSIFVSYGVDRNHCQSRSHILCIKTISMTKFTMSITCFMYK